jgi:hypothetical protein
MMISRTLVSPCKDCDDRCIGCHTTCGDYTEYTRELDRRRKDIKAENDITAFEKAIKKKIAKANRDRRKGDDR